MTCKVHCRRRWRRYKINLGVIVDGAGDVQVHCKSPVAPMPYKGPLQVGVGWHRCRTRVQFRSALSGADDVQGPMQVVIGNARHPLPSLRPMQPAHRARLTGHGRTPSWVATDNPPSSATTAIAPLRSVLRTVMCIERSMVTVDGAGWP